MSISTNPGRSQLRYRPIPSWLEEKPVVRRRSLENPQNGGHVSARQPSQLPQVDVLERKGVRLSPRHACSASMTRQPRPIRGRSDDVLTEDYLAEARPDECLDEEEQTVFHRIPARRSGGYSSGQTSVPPTAARGGRRARPSVAEPSRLSKGRRRSIFAGILAILIFGALLGIHSGVWALHAQAIRNDVVSRFGGHAPSDSLTLGHQVVFARNDGATMNVYFIPGDSGQGTMLVQQLDSSKLGNPALVVPSLSLEKGALFLKLVGTPVYPSWTQPVVTYRLEPTVNGYQAVPVV